MLLTRKNFLAPPGNKTLLYNLSWQDFEAIQRELGSECATKVAYDQGTLEIMTPLPEHEYYKEKLSDFIKEIARILKIPYQSFGSTTWQQERVGAGAEPDNCFYFPPQEAAVRGKVTIDLAQDPPPNLVLEIDLTSSSLNKLGIYARLGIPEVWNFSAGKLTVYLLEEEVYYQSERSLVFPQLPILELPELLRRCQGKDIFEALETVRKWVSSSQKS